MAAPDEQPDEDDLFQDVVDRNAARKGRSDMEKHENKTLEQLGTTSCCNPRIRNAPVFLGANSLCYPLTAFCFVYALLAQTNSKIRLRRTRLLRSAPSG